MAFRTSKPMRIGDSEFLKELQRKVNDPEWLAKHSCTEEEAIERSAAVTAAEGELPVERLPTASSWPPGFEARCYALGLREYMVKLDQIMTGQLKANSLFNSFRKKWMDNSRTWEGAIITGASGSGKSIVSLWACMRASYAMQQWEHLDAGLFASLWASQDHDRLRSLSRVGLLVIDEVGDCEDIKGPAFGQMKTIINTRYKDRRTTILCTTQDEGLLKDAIGDEIVDRFQIRVGTADKQSWRK